MPRVLVVDDAADIRLLVRAVLEGAGHDVLEADSGPAALDLIATGATLDVALFDIQMPDMDGWDLLARLRDGPPGGRPRVIVCSVKAGAADVHRAWQLGADGYLTKPFSITDLETEVFAVWMRSDAERERRQAAVASASDADARIRRSSRLPSRQAST